MTITMPREHQTADSSHTHLMNRPRWSIPTYVVKQAHENAAKITREGLHEAVRRVIGDVRSKDHGSREEPERGRVGGMREEEEGGGDVRGEGEVREGDDVPPAQMDVESRTQSGGVELSLDTGDQPLVITDDEALSDAESLTQTGLVEHSLTTREQPVVMPDDEDLPDADLPVQSPTLTPPPQVSELRKESQRPRPEDRRSKKMMARAQQVKEGITVNQAMRKVKEKKSRTLSIPAESSRAGAVREAATNTTTTSTPSTAIMPNLPMAEVSTDRYPVRPLPKWYTSINETGFEMKQLGRKKPQDLTALESLKGYITQCQSERGPSALHKLHEALRNEVHKAEIKLSVTKFILKKARILSPDTGLPAIFRKDANFPPDLKADSFQLYNRWYNQDFDQDILRGIITKADKDRNNDSLDPKYRAQHPASAKYYGQGNLVLGQWWPTQLCTMRDGAHGAAQGGIFGSKDKGTYSIVLSSGTGYHDLDHGTTIHYSGTASLTQTPTENTLHLLTSIALQNPIRVIRSHQLPKSNPYRPSVGLRYDGLYRAKSYVVVDGQKAAYRFLLERCEGQEGIRCAGDAARRPTVFEEEALAGLKVSKGW